MTNLENEFPTHAVGKWLGNSPAVAHKHFLKVTDEHFGQATQGGAKAAQNPAQSLHAASGQERTGMAAKQVASRSAESVSAATPNEKRGFGKTPKTPGNGRYWTRNCAENSGKTSISIEGGAESGALDADLARVAEAWPGLTPGQRRAILTIVDGNQK